MTSCFPRQFREGIIYSLSSLLFIFPSSAQNHKIKFQDISNKMSTYDQNYCKILSLWCHFRISICILTDLSMYIYCISYYHFSKYKGLFVLLLPVIICITTYCIISMKVYLFYYIYCIIIYILYYSYSIFWWYSDFGLVHKTTDTFFCNMVKWIINHITKIQETVFDHELYHTMTSSSAGRETLIYCVTDCCKHSRYKVIESVQIMPLFKQAVLMSPKEQNRYGSAFFSFFSQLTIATKKKTEPIQEPST